MSGNYYRYLVGIDVSSAGLDSADLTIFGIAQQFHYFGVLVNLDTTIIRRARITPGHRIVTGDAAARLEGSTENRLTATLVDIDLGDSLFDFLW